MNDITIGKWVFNKAPADYLIQPEGDDENYIADIYSCYTGTGEANANFIVTCQNQCYDINPENPLAVAESIKDMYDALKMMYKYAMIHPVEGVIYPEGSHKEWIKHTERILAKVEVK
jgi:hypothetical protein